MANSVLFKSPKGRQALGIDESELSTGEPLDVPETDAINEAGGRAYLRKAKAALAHYVVTGCLNATYYADAETQLQTVLQLCAAVEPAFVAKAAIYARSRGYMKDMPALLTAWLAQHGRTWLEPAFAQVIDNGRMLRTFVQILRSGQVGRVSLGSQPKRLIQNWLNHATDRQLLGASVGQAPSLADIVKLAHPKPATPEQAMFYARLIGKPHNVALLPEAVKALERFRTDLDAPVPDVPFQLLTALPLQSRHWVAIARQASWQMTRMNLNTFIRHGVFKVDGMTQCIADRLRDPPTIRQARVFPYQLLNAYFMADQQLPSLVREALSEALEVALENIPALSGQIYVLLDVSGSMSSPVTGYRPGATSNVRCIDVAALIAAALWTKNPKTHILPFDTQLHQTDLRWKEGVFANAQALSRFGGGGTNCSLPLAWLNQQGALGDLVVYVSDNESWVDARRWGGTETMRQWQLFHRRNPKARLACIDLQPSMTVQAPSRKEILNIGGFSDAVFEVLTHFVADRWHGGYWLQEIDKIVI